MSASFTLAGAIAQLRHPVTTLCALFILSCILTRLFTGIRYRLISRDFSRQANAVPGIPYWIPWLGHTLPLLRDSNKYLSRLSENTNHGIFTTVLSGKKCHMVISPSLAKQVLSVQAAANNNDLVTYFMRTVWDDKGGFGRVLDDKTLRTKLHRAIHHLGREPFLSRGGDVVTTNIESTILDLVSHSNGCPPNWQTHANVISQGYGLAEASLFPLIRHYVADMVLPAVFGTDLMRNYPSCAKDAFTVDDSFYLLLAGIPPSTPLIGIREGVAARTRLKTALGELHDAVAASLRDEAPPGNPGRWADLQNVSNIMTEGVRAWEDMGCPRETYTAAHALLFWGTLVNANVVIFWLLFHVYQDPVLLADVRREVDPFVAVHMDTVKLNSQGIKKETPLLQSAFLETMRLYTQTTVLKTVQDDFEIVESAAARYTPGRTYRLHKGDTICVPLGVPQSDPQTYENAQMFNARRFLVTDENGKASADYTRIHPWGMGANVCKGQKFSQREVLELAAAILTCWDVEPVGKDGWTHPGLKMAGGTAAPREDVGVCLRRRGSTGV